VSFIPEDDSLLLDMARAARDIASFIGSQRYDQFLSDRKTQSAVLHELLIIGEVTKKLSPDFQASHRDIAWREIGRMRDKLIHHYRQVDTEEVWRMASVDVPNLLRYIVPLLPSEADGG